MNLLRAYGSTLLTILSLAKDARGIPSGLSLRVEDFSPRFVGNEIPPKRNALRFHPQSHDCGFSRRGIRLLLCAPLAFLITGNCIFLSQASYKYVNSPQAKARGIFMLCDLFHKSQNFTTSPHKRRGFK